MNACVKCGHTLSDSAKFCDECGQPTLSANDAKFAFEIGKIAALASIKKDVLVWIGGTTSVVGVVLAVLAFLGMNEVVKSTVSQQLASEIKNMRDGIDKTRQELAVDVGKAQQNQSQIANLLTEANNKLALTSKEIEALLQEAKRKLSDAKASQDLLEASINGVISEKDKLVEAIKNLNIGALIAKLRHDFYRIRDFSANMVWTIRPDLNFSDNDIPPIAVQVDMHGRSTEDRNAPNIVMQMLPASGGWTNMRSDNERLVAIRSPQLMPFAPYAESALNKEISTYDGVIAIVVIFATPGENVKKLDEFIASLKSVTVSVKINQIGLWNVEILQSDIAFSGDANGRYEVHLRAIIPEEKDGLISRYERAFENQLTRSH